LTTLLYIWLAITALMIIAWLIQRRRSRSLVDASAGQAVPHPALVTFDGAEESDRSQDSKAKRASDSQPTVKATPAAVESGRLLDDDADDDTPGDEKIVILGNQGGDMLDGNPTFTDEANPAGDEAMTSLSDPSTDAGPPATAAPRTLSDMLDGIKLPYDLTPVTAAVEDPDRHLIFLTTHSNAEEVGTKFADELIRLGYGFEPVGLDQAVASRNADVVSMLIVPKAAEVETGNGPRYGAAAVGDVALELWVGRRPAPPVVPELGRA
jgi:hypothetical protein